MTVHSGGYNRKGKWNDLSCMEQRGFVCQTPAGQILLNPNSLLQAEEQVKIYKTSLKKTAYFINDLLRNKIVSNFIAFHTDFSFRCIGYWRNILPLTYRLLI